MIASAVLSEACFRKIQRADTCVVSNAIERLKGRMRNDGVISPSALHAIFPKLPPMLGYAATGRMRSTTPPVAGRAFHENISWWRYVASVPAPRVMVVEDVDERPGAGALVGELHAVIGLALNCVGYVSNGSVRDLPAVEALGFQLFAGGAAVCHMFAHITEYGSPVELGDLKICPGDLIHGDCHGVQTIPWAVAEEVPAMVAQILREEKQLKTFCQLPQFSLDGLEKKLQDLPGDGFELPIGGR